MGATKENRCNMLFILFLIFLEQRFLVSELNIKVNQMLDSRIYVMRACAQPVFFLLLDFIFGELDTYMCN